MHGRNTGAADAAWSHDSLSQLQLIIAVPYTRTTDPPPPPLPDPPRTTPDWGARSVEDFLGAFLKNLVLAPVLALVRELVLELVLALVLVLVLVPVLVLVLVLPASFFFLLPSS